MGGRKAKRNDSRFGQVFIKSKTQIGRNIGAAQRLGRISHIYADVNAKRELTNRGNARRWRAKDLGWRWRWDGALSRHESHRVVRRRERIPTRKHIASGEAALGKCNAGINRSVRGPATRRAIVSMKNKGGMALEQRDIKHRGHSERGKPVNDVRVRGMRANLRNIEARSRIRGITFRVKEPLLTNQRAKNPEKKAEGIQHERYGRKQEKERHSHIFRSIRMVTRHTAKNLRKFSPAYERFNSYDGVTPQTALRIERNTTAWSLLVHFRGAKIMVLFNCPVDTERATGINEAEATAGIRMDIENEHLRVPTRRSKIHGGIKAKRKNPGFGASAANKQNIGRTQRWTAFRKNTPCQTRHQSRVAVRTTVGIAFCEHREDCDNKNKKRGDTAFEQRYSAGKKPANNAQAIYNASNLKNVEAQFRILISTGVHSQLPEWELAKIDHGERRSRRVSGVDIMAESKKERASHCAVYYPT
ncbi:hypothetical protein C8R45DRAFT_1073968 [Mycena sanguinolenta]|nr:hypothetical protein C8R45DRAFT_1073968 [Mycena sanguinolenta]